MMNAELFAADQERIVIPTGVSGQLHRCPARADAVGAVRSPCNARSTTPGAGQPPFHGGNLKSTEAVLRACHAFDTPGEAERRGVRLRMPPPSETPHGP